MIAAFLCGMLVTAAAVLPHGMGPAAQGSAPALYYDMGTAHVQYPDAECGTRTLAVAYQFEYGSDERTAFITTYKPKLEAELFAALSDHLRETGNTRVAAIRKIMARAVDGVLGEGVVSDVLITEIQVLGV
jgi:hypothetical protein